MVQPKKTNKPQSQKKQPYKTINNIVATKPYISVIALNIIGLNSLLKR